MVGEKVRDMTNETLSKFDGDCSKQSWKWENCDFKGKGSRTNEQLWVFVSVIPKLARFCCGSFVCVPVSYFKHYKPSKSFVSWLKFKSTTSNRPLLSVYIICLLRIVHHYFSSFTEPRVCAVYLNYYLLMKSSIKTCSSTNKRSWMEIWSALLAVNKRGFADWNQ